MKINLAELQESITGCILGTAVGDAIGLPMERISRSRLQRLYPKIGGHHFSFGHGMVSDDTEHTCMVAQSLIESAGEPRAFARALAGQLKLWLLILPAGAGLATLKASLRLLVGFGPDRSGVYSAGNGPAMRSAIIGVCYGDDREKMRELVRASTRITHTDPKAEYGAFAAALAAYYSSRGFDPSLYCQELSELLGGDGNELLALITRAADSASAGQSTVDFAGELGYGTGVRGYVYSTVPIVLQAWFKNPGNYREAVIEVIKCGGDTDTTAAILGGIIGAGAGKEGIPEDWLNGIMEWPRSIHWMEALGATLSQVVISGKCRKMLSISSIGALARNVFFMIVVILHGFRRMLPPY